MDDRAMYAIIRKTDRGSSVFYETIANLQQIHFCFAPSRSRRFSTKPSVPEPASVLGLLAIGALGAGSTLKRKKKGDI